LRPDDPPKGLAPGHAIGCGGFGLGSGHRLHADVKHIGGKSVKADREGQKGKKERVEFVLPFERDPEGKFCRVADEEIIVLPDLILPIGAEELVAEAFKPWSSAMTKKMEKAMSGTPRTMAI